MTTTITPEKAAPTLRERVGAMTGEYGLQCGGPNADLAPTTEWATRWSALLAEIEELELSAEVRFLHRDLTPEQKQFVPDLPWEDVEQLYRTAVSDQRQMTYASRARSVLDAIGRLLVVWEGSLMLLHERAPGAVERSITPVTPTALVLIEVEKERRRQDEQWGGPAHDDLHSTTEWHRFREKFSQTAQYTHHDGERRSALVKIAALAVAQIESIDRTPKGGV